MFVNPSSQVYMTSLDLFDSEKFVVYVVDSDALKYHHEFQWNNLSVGKNVHYLMVWQIFAHLYNWKTILFFKNLETKLKLVIYKFND